MNRRELLTGAAALAGSAVLPEAAVAYDAVNPVMRPFVGVDPGFGGFVVWTVVAIGQDGKRTLIDSWREPVEPELVIAGIVRGSVSV